MSEDRPDRDPMIGRLFADRFHVECHIGTGGMGHIYRARQIDMDRGVALKVLHPALGADREVLARFDREARATTRIEHPNTVRVYEHGQAHGQRYLAMELLEGKPLNDVIAEDAPMPSERVAYIGMQIALGLAAAHSAQIVHRDLKPENVMLLDRYEQQDFVKVLDFGLSRSAGEEEEGRSSDSGVTQSGVRVGTPMYMAPEYISAFAFDHRSDLYALGMILYEMATGRTPYIGRPHEILEQQVDAEPRAPSAQPGARVPVWLEDIILRLLRKDPADRPGSALEVARTLERGRAVLISQPPTHLQADDETTDRHVLPRPAAPLRPLLDDDPPDDLGITGSHRLGPDGIEITSGAAAHGIAIGARRTLTPIRAPRTSHPPAARREVPPRPRLGLVVAGVGALVLLAIGALVGAAVALGSWVN
jgi:serine/threonine protein kinase